MSFHRNLVKKKKNMKRSNLTSWSVFYTFIDSRFWYKKSNYDIILLDPPLIQKPADRAYSFLVGAKGVAKGTEHFYAGAILLEDYKCPNVMVLADGGVIVYSV